MTPVPEPFPLFYPPLFFSRTEKIMSNIVIIGAGAAGMAAAITAAGHPEHHITLLERQSRVGKKLMATGNGRCNLTNTGASPAHYHGAESDFVKSVLHRFPPEAVLEFFRSLGLLTTEEYGGRVYPKSGHASSVLDVLRLGLEQENITLITDAQVEYLRREKDGFAVSYDGNKICADKVIVACGGCAGSKLGGTMDGYHLLRAMGHSRTALYPALTQIRTAPEYPKAMKGIKVEARAQVLRGREILSEALGDVLFSDSGVSGTAVFEISRAAASGGEGLDLMIDFFPEWKENDLYQYLKGQAAKHPNLTAEKLFTGALQSRVGQTLCKAAKVPPQSPAESLRDRDLRNLSKAAKAFYLPITGVSGFETAQVTAGGIQTAEFNPSTMESRLVPGLYACGEVLDVDGDCGGYNLQWAWASGMLAGMLLNS